MRDHKLFRFFSDISDYAKLHHLHHFIDLP